MPSCHCKLDTCSICVSHRNQFYYYRYWIRRDTLISSVIFSPVYITLTALGWTCWKFQQAYEIIKKHDESMTLEN